MRVRNVSMMVLCSAMVGCYAGDEYETESGDGVSAIATSALTVGGHYCPQSGAIASRVIPRDDNYFITTFGGGADSGTMACGRQADGRWLYIADSWRFGCGAKVKVTNPRTGRWCVAQVADVGPNICVERAAGRPIIDASPMLTRYLFNTSGAGWSDRITVHAELVRHDTALGCGTGSGPSTMPADTNPGRDCFSATYQRTMEHATCLQSRFDHHWYQCTNEGWQQSTTITSSRRGPAGACERYISL